jgi:hypothetical protein
MVKNRTTKVGFCKVNLMQRGIDKPGVLQVHVGKRAEFDRTVFKTHCEEKIAAVLKMKPQQLTILEPDISKGGVAKGGHAELAANEQ